LANAGDITSEEEEHAQSLLLQHNVDRSVLRILKIKNTNKAAMILKKYLSKHVSEKSF